LDRSVLEQAASLSEAVSAATDRVVRESMQSLADTLDAMVVPWQEQARAVAESLTLALDTTGLERMLDGLSAWRALDAGQRADTARILEESFHAAQVGDTQQVPDDLVAGLGDSARQFAEERDGFISPEMQRQLFMYFCGLVVLLALMQASLTSETADALIEKSIALSPVAVVAMAASGKAWDRYVRRPDSEDDAEGGGDAGR